ncbi:MAG TPA: type II secretion system F family protein [Stellaceae bacterium]|nr:type II secretion system F family protein [Stellaceae bacterium]
MSLDTLYHNLIYSENFGAILAGIGVFISIMALSQALVPHDPMASRLRSHKKRREVLRSEIVSGGKSEERRRASLGILKRLLDRMKLLRGEEANKTSDFLAQAGWRSRDFLMIYIGLRLVMPFLGGIGGFFLNLSFRPASTSLDQLMAVLVGAVVLGFAPQVGLKWMIKRRKHALRKQLPDGLDLLVICAEAGLSLDAALTRVGREIGYASPDLADEIGLTAIELSFLPNRRQALMNLAKRTDLPSIRGVANTLVQTERYGTPLAHSLRVLSHEFRDERMMRAEEKAAKLPAVLTVPMIMFILPTIFMILLGPAIIQVIDTFKNN